MKIVQQVETYKSYAQVVAASANMHQQVKAVADKLEKAAHNHVTILKKEQIKQRYYT